MGGRRGSFQSLVDGDFFFFLNIQLKDRKEREKEDPCIAKQIGGFLLVLSWYDLGNGFKNRNHSFWQYKNLQ